MKLTYLFPISASVTWGLIYALDQKILRTTSPFVFLFIDAIITIGVFLPIFLWNRAPLQEITRMNKQEMGLIIITVLLTILADILILFGVKHLDASKASLIEISYPLFVVLFAFLFYRTTPTLPVLIGGFLIFLGSAVIVRYGS